MALYLLLLLLFLIIFLKIVVVLAVFIVILYDQKGVDKGNRKEEKTTVSIVELVVLCNDNIIIDMIFVEKRWRSLGSRVTYKGKEMMR